MLAYPGYTIEKIEVELSWRRVGAMMDLWEGENAEPTFQRMQRIVEILKKAHGIKYAKSADATSDADLIGSFHDLGFMG